MTMKTIALTAVLALALPMDAYAQEGRELPSTERRERTEAERAEMRERIEARFLDMTAERLELDASQRTALASVLERDRQQRREIAEEGMRLRREAADVLDDGTPDRARAERILAELTRLRERELQLWRAEQDALAAVLTPEQRLEFMAIQARFHDRVRNVRRERGPAGAGMHAPRRDGAFQGRGARPLRPSRGAVEPSAP